MQVCNQKWSSFPQTVIWPQYCCEEVACKQGIPVHRHAGSGARPWHRQRPAAACVSVSRVAPRPRRLRGATRRVRPSPDGTNSGPVGMRTRQVLTKQGQRNTRTCLHRRPHAATDRPNFPGSSGTHRSPAGGYQGESRCVKSVMLLMLENFAGKLVEPRSPIMCFDLFRDHPRSHCYNLMFLPSRFRCFPT